MSDGILKIAGMVRRDGQSVEGAYLDLMQAGEFIAERRTGPDGTYEFHTTAGDWEIRCRAAGADMVSRSVSSAPGEVSVDFDLGA
jgi:hypothetical protein